MDCILRRVVYVLLDFTNKTAKDLNNLVQVKRLKNNKYGRMVQNLRKMLKWNMKALASIVMIKQYIYIYIHIFVKFENRDDPKSRGAKWDADKKRLYAPNDKDKDEYVNIKGALRIKFHSYEMFYTSNVSSVQVTGASSGGRLGSAVTPAASLATRQPCASNSLATPFVTTRATFGGGGIGAPVRRGPRARGPGWPWPPRTPPVAPAREPTKRREQANSSPQWKECSGTEWRRAQRRAA
jgi:hypothetical protein